jgi:ssDNA-binding Zn-finger/Zn-ribbon topoisomerase 1
MTDKTLVCKDCGKEFVFTAGEQEFYKTKGFDQEPKRCPECRKANKERNRDRRNSRPDYRNNE